MYLSEWRWNNEENITCGRYIVFYKLCSDLYIRDGTGVDLLQEVKKNHRIIPFILLSGSDYNLHIKMAEHYGAIFIPKGEFDLIKQIVTFADNNKKPTE